MKTRIIVLAACVAAVIALSFAGVMNAEALQAGCTRSTPTTSLPYVEDVNPTKSNVYVALVTCCGKSTNLVLKVRDTKTKRAVKAKRVGKRAWEVRMKRGHVYRISVKAKGGTWKRIAYGVM